ncbi:MAG TPA: DMT family transporter, partial [Alphaproteobacteria bacterium]|nr:DMT family transporter [Alphaproteobacteria bacterium]
VATTRACLMTVGLLLFCLVSGRPLRLPRGTRWHALGLGALTAVMFYGNIAAVQFIPVGLAALLFFTYPPMIAILNVAVVRERLPLAKLAAVLLAFAGLALMLGISLGAADPRGMALSLAAALATAWNALWLARRVAHVDAFVLTFYMAVVAAAMLLSVSLAAGGIAWPEAPGGWAGLFGVAALQGSSVPIYFFALARIGALKSGVITNLQPVVSIVAAYLLFGELLAPVQFLGGAMVLAGIGLMQWSDARRR